MSVRSMTGFGAASREAPGITVRAEVKSVNNRGLSVTVRCPAFAEPHSAAFEAVVRRHAVRGTVNVSLTIGRTRGAAPVRIAREVVADYAEQTAAVARETGLGAPSLAEILRLPGALEEAPARGLGDDEAAIAAAAVDQACTELVAMRDREGAALEGELRGIVAQIAEFASRVESRSPAAVLAQRDRLRERVSQLLASGQTVPEDLVAREIALLADRTDVAEEVARLRSHIAQWNAALDEGGPVGRRLDFLTQEFGRETNTIGSKCQDAEIARLVVEAKVAVERLREQAANLE